MKTKNQDLLFSNRAVFSLVWPIMIEMGLNTTIGLVNSVMVSSMGLEAVSAVSLVDSLNILILNLFNALAAGVTVVVSHCMGRNEKKLADETVTQIFSITVLFASAVAVVFLTLNRPLLSLMFGRVDEAVMSSALIYNVGSAISYPFIAAFSICAGSLRATGDSRTPMIAALASNIVNIGVGALTIMVLGWGMVGAACAVLCARVTSSLILYVKTALRPGMVSINGFVFKVKKELLMPVLKVGIPAGIDSLIFNGGKILVVVFMTGMGTDALGANSISNTIANFALITGSAFSNAGVTITGRCYGAKLYDEAKMHLRRLPLMSSICYGLSMAILWFCVPAILRMYNATPLASEYVYRIVRILMVGGTLSWSTAFVLPNCLRGVGDINFNTVVSVSSMWICRVALGYLLGVVMGLQVVGVWIAMIADWSFRSVCFLWRMRSGRWHRRALAKDGAPS